MQSIFWNFKTYPISRVFFSKTSEYDLSYRHWFFHKVNRQVTYQLEVRRWNACYCISAAERRRNAVAKNAKYGHEPVETVGSFPRYLLHRSGAANCIFRNEKNRFRNVYYDVRTRVTFMVYARFYGRRRFVRSNQPKRFRLLYFVWIFGCFRFCWVFFRSELKFNGFIFEFHVVLIGAV